MFQFGQHSLPLVGDLLAYGCAVTFSGDEESLPLEGGGLAHACCS